MEKDTIKCMQLLGIAAKKIDDKRNGRYRKNFLFSTFNPCSVAHYRNYDMNVEFLLEGVAAEKVQMDIDFNEAIDLYSKNKEEIKANRDEAFVYFAGAYFKSK